jgi:hypothetical protein
MWKLSAVVIFLAVVVAQTAFAAPAKQNTIRATHLNPLIVVGDSFAHARRLSVTASTGSKRQTRSVVTTAAGTFTVSFNLTIDRCLAGATVVVRLAGHTATLVQLKVPMRECPPSP